MKDLFKSPYNAFRADILDVLPIVAGGGAAVIGGFAGPTGAIAVGVLAGGGTGTYEVEASK